MGNTERKDQGMAVEALLENGTDPSLCSEAGWRTLTFAIHRRVDTVIHL